MGGRGREAESEGVQVREKTRVEAEYVNLLLFAVYICGVYY